MGAVGRTALSRTAATAVTAAVVVRQMECGFGFMILTSLHDCGWNYPFTVLPAMGYVRLR
jgi:hypothetical protein